MGEKDIRCTMVVNKGKEIRVNVYLFEQDQRAEPFKTFILEAALFAAIAGICDWSIKKGYRLLKIEILF